MTAVIYETGTLRVIGVCDGPDSTGSCPRFSQGHIFCAGKDLVQTKDDVSAYCDGLKRGRFTVSPDSICPLASHTPDCHLTPIYFSPFACRQAPIGNQG
jgi:hypothetical protein